MSFDWKEFLRPSWKKAIVFVIFFLVLGFLMGPAVFFYRSLPVSLIYELPILAISYLLACAIVAIFPKSTKKK